MIELMLMTKVLLFIHDITRASFDPCLLHVPQLVKCVLIYSLKDHLYIMLPLQPTLWNTIELDILLFYFDALKKNQNTSLSEVLCKFILIMYRFTV